MNIRTGSGKVARLWKRLTKRTTRPANRREDVEGRVADAQEQARNPSPWKIVPIL
jgi:hypothetical protein